MQKKSFKPPSMAVKLQGETKSMNTENVAPNREYKDRLFKAIYGRNTEQSKKWRLELYNALNGTNYKNLIKNCIPAIFETTNLRFVQSIV